MTSRMKWLQGRARVYRKRHSLGRGGYVVFFNGWPCGWTCDLTNPQAWRPGCIALSLNAAEGLRTSVGGGYNQGSDEWQAVADLPPTPITASRTVIYRVAVR